MTWHVSIERDAIRENKPWIVTPLPATSSFPISWRLGATTDDTELVEGLVLTQKVPGDWVGYWGVDFKWFYIIHGLSSYHPLFLGLLAISTNRIFSKQQHYFGKDLWNDEIFSERLFQTGSFNLGFIPLIHIDSPSRRPVRVYWRRFLTHTRQWGLPLNWEFLIELFSWRYAICVTLSPSQESFTHRRSWVDFVLRQF